MQFYAAGTAGSSLAGLSPLPPLSPTSTSAGGALTASLLTATVLFRPSRSSSARAPRSLQCTASRTIWPCISWACSGGISGITFADDTFAESVVCAAGGRAVDLPAEQLTAVCWLRLTWRQALTMLRQCLAKCQTLQIPPATGGVQRRPRLCPPQGAWAQGRMLQSGTRGCCRPCSTRARLQLGCAHALSTKATLHGANRTTHQRMQLTAYSSALL